MGAAAKTVSIAPSVARYRPLEEMTPAEIFDEFGTLDLEESQDEPRKERLKLVKEHIIRMAEAEPAAAPVIYDGAAFTLQLTPRAIDREVKSPEKLYKYIVSKWGVKRLWQLCKFQMGALKDLDRRAEFVSESQTGTRRVYAVPKVASKAIPIK